MPAETALDVAITVTRLIAAATLKSRPSAAFRNGHEEDAAADAEQ